MEGNQTGEKSLLGSSQHQTEMLGSTVCGLHANNCNEGT